MKTDETKVIAEDTPKKTENRFANNSAFAAGGFVAGSATTSAVNLNAAEAAEEAPVEDLPETPAIEDVPEESEVILATDEGIRVAQVDDDASFAEAFADARSQVGPGGVFEWQGKVYNTYYKEEWDAMSDTERSEFQHRIDYDDVSDNNNIYASAAETHTTSSSDGAPVEMIDDSGDSDVEVIVGEIDGMDAAIVSADGAEMLLVDVDDDGTMDVLIADVNNDGYISDNEGVNISSEGIEMNDLYAMQNGDVCYASNDSMPDYMNSADTGMYQA